MHIFMHIFPKQIVHELFVRLDINENQYYDHNYDFISNTDNNISAF